VALAAVTAVLVLGLVLINAVRSGDDAAVQPAATLATDQAVQAGATADPALADDVADTLEFVPVVEETPEPSSDLIEDTGCMLEDTEVKLGDSGENVACAQRALRAAGFYDGEISGEFDVATDTAAKLFQAEVELYVDGIVGKNTATELGIWPGNEFFIVRTPKPAAGATDLWGMPLSSVASAGSNAPELPPDAGEGSGKRIVYQRAGQRVWAIDDEERVVRSYLVSGSQYRNEVPGVHTVYSKSENALGWDLTANLPYMIRYTQTERGHIGFHAIPSWNDTGEKLQTEDELGQKLSGGCTRQALRDAEFLWEFADVGTKVWVL
jgi:lipoprotein-anchoring transpeptidase ErfK/SrfK